MNQRSWTVGRFSSVALQRGRRSASLCVKTNLAGSVLAGSSLQHCTSLGSVVSSQRRGYYEDIKRKRDGSDTDGPEAFFEDFPKSPHVQQVPQDLHKTNKAAVGAAESMSMGFAAVIAFLFAVLLVAGKLEWDDGLPHSGRRPAGYGVSPPRDSSAPYRDSIFKKE